MAEFEQPPVGRRARTQGAGLPTVEPVDKCWVGAKLLSDLRSAILGGGLADGSRLAPLRELARQYAISTTAAHVAVGELAKQGLIKRRQGSGSYVSHKPAQSAGSVKAGRQPGVTAAPAALMLDTKGHIYGPLAEEIINRLQEQGVETFNIGWRQDAGVEQLRGVLERWRQRPPRALVIGREAVGLDEAIQEAIGGTTRIIAAYRTPMRVGIHPVVDVDQGEIAVLAVEHLMAKGHRRIGLVLNERTVHPNYPWTQWKRTTGHGDLILAAGHHMRRAGIRHGLSIYYTRFDESHWPFPVLSEKGTADLKCWLLQADRPTAIVGADFRVATVMHEARRLGLAIPGDLEIVGLYNTPWAAAAGFDSVSVEEMLAAREIVRLVLADESSLGGPGIHLHMRPRLVAHQQSIDKRPVPPGAESHA